MPQTTSLGTVVNRPVVVTFAPPRPTTDTNDQYDTEAPCSRHNGYTRLSWCSYVSILSLLSALSILSCTSLASILSINSIGSLMSTNSIFSVLSVNSMFAVGCSSSEIFSICFE